MKYTRKQKRALEAFIEYISCEQPYQDMSKRTYNKLGKYYHNLPEEVFSIPPSRSLYHTSRPTAKQDKLTHSGVVSCTTNTGKKCIASEWYLHKGDLWWRLRKRKAVDVMKLYDIACNVGVSEPCTRLENRITKEDEYILPLERVEVLSKRVIKERGSNE